MNLKYYYWYYKNALPGWLCDALVSNVLKDQQIKTGLVNPKKGGVTDLKIRDSNICFLTDQWLKSVLTFYMQDANQRAGWNFRTMAPNKARAKLNAICIDNEFYKDGLKIYLKILGYENQNEWLNEQITTRVRAEGEENNFGCFG